jgi:hypothetical protein
MKRLFLVAGLCIAAALVAPVASASAETLAGECKIHGTASFSTATEAEAELTLTPRKLKYKFTSKAGGKVIVVGGAGAECDGVRLGNPSGGRVHLSGSATVEGEGTLSCGASVSEGEGPGTLTLGTESYPFNLTFVGKGPNVTLAATPIGAMGASSGEATFANSEIEPAAKCLTGGGVKKLEFEAVAAGVI